MSSAPTRRHNGLEAPHSRMQISTWFFLPILVVQFCVFCAPILPLWAAIFCTIAFMLCAAATAISGYISTALDPMDPHLSHDDDYKEKLSGFVWRKIFRLPPRQPPPTAHSHDHVPGVMRNEEPSAPDGEEDPADKLKYCWICEDEVHHQSMHCRYCNKCVSKFDHHCQWLNTCVGERNYGFFYKTLWSILCMLTVHISVLLATSIDILASGETKLRAEKWFNANLWELVVAVNLAFFLFDSAALVLIVQLLAFHLKLRRLGLTTYQFILKDNAEKREANKLKTERQAKRTVAMGHAKRDKKTILRYRLAAGKYLERIHPCLDPLPRETSSQQSPQSDDEENGVASWNNDKQGGAEETKNEEVEVSINGHEHHETMQDEDSMKR